MHTHIHTHTHAHTHTHPHTHTPTHTPTHPHTHIVTTQFSRYDATAFPHYYIATLLCTTTFLYICITDYSILTFSLHFLPCGHSPPTSPLTGRRGRGARCYTARTPTFQFLGAPREKSAHHPDYCSQHQRQQVCYALHYYITTLLTASLYYSQHY